MGNSRWNNDDYTSYARSTNYVSKSRDEVFAHRVNEKLDPRNVKVGKGERTGLQLRESIISDSNPNPTPIILGLDVTGSMGSVAEQIAKEELPKLMTRIHETGIVSDPHVMFMGIDDVFAQGHGALQVSYFEPDLRIVEQLRQMWLVGNGGGNGSESYDLAWYFAGHHTYLEGFEKQGRKGFLFTFGDEPAPFQDVSKRDLEIIFGPGNYEGASPEASLRAAQQKFKVFHIVVEHGVSNRGVRESWTEMLGPNAIFLRNRKYLTEIVIATMAIANGADFETVLTESTCPNELRYAFSNSIGV
jgi:hypothetical protein